MPTSARATRSRPPWAATRSPRRCSKPATHEVHVWYGGLASVALHLQRVRERVTAGGHDIPEGRIRERFVRSPLSLTRLMPHLAQLCVFDNSTPAAADGTVPDPVLVLSMTDGVIQYPRLDDVNTLKDTPDWAKPLVAAASP